MKWKHFAPLKHYISYEFEKYRQVSEAFYEIMFQYADELQAVSVDEALVDVSSHVTLLDGGQEEALAREIQNKIKQEPGCQVSIGISYNILLARYEMIKKKIGGII
jgi:DNA repair protein REV1